MKIVIIGGGKVGYAIAAQLTHEGHDITVVDQNPAVAERIGDTLDCMSICGRGATVAVMEEAGVPTSDLVIACTHQDELNMLCCVFAKRLGCGSAIARVRMPEYAQQMYLLKDGLGLSTTMNPEQTAAREMFRLMEIPGVLKRESFAGGRVEIVEIVCRAGDLLDGASLMDLPKKFKFRVFVGAVQRDSDTYIPDGSFTLRAGDKVYICAPATQLVHILRTLGEHRKKARRVLLIGGSRVAEYLTEMLLKAGTEVKLIEQDRQKAEYFFTRFPGAQVICADGSSERVLAEENAESMDAVAMMTGRDEQNLILSMYVGGLGVPQLLTQVDHTEFGTLIQDPHNHLISPKQLCADEMVRYVRALQNSGGSSVVTLHHLAGGKVDALEFNVTASCRGKGKQLRDIRLKRNILIACINRMGRIIIPGGLDTVEVGDTVVVITDSHRKILDLNDIYADED